MKKELSYWLFEKKKPRRGSILTVDVAGEKLETSMRIVDYKEGSVIDCDGKKSNGWLVATENKNKKR